MLQQCSRLCMQMSKVLHKEFVWFKSVVLLSFHGFQKEEEERTTFKQRVLQTLVQCLK